MTSPSTTGLDDEPSPGPSEPVRVAPRYLAGSGNDPHAPFRMLVEEHHWPCHQTRQGLFAGSPDWRVMVGYLPDNGPNHFNVIARQGVFDPPRWRANFCSQTPIEIVTAFVAEVAHAHAADPKGLLVSDLDPRAAVAPLLSSGWTMSRRDAHTIVSSPDRLASLSLEHREADYFAQFERGQAAWLMTAGRRSAHPYFTAWSAVFISGTPAFLIARAARAVADPAPVVRDLHHVPELHLAHVDVAPLATAPPAPAVLPPAAVAPVTRASRTR